MIGGVPFVFGGGVMGKAFCICGQGRSCCCFSGWGSHFEDLDELLEEIDEEIRAEERRLDLPRAPLPKSPEVPDGFVVIGFIL